MRLSKPSLAEEHRKELSTVLDGRDHPSEWFFLKERGMSRTDGESSDLLNC